MALAKRAAVALLIVLAILVPAARSGLAQEWTRFRGPNGAGHGQADSIPAKWTEAHYNWKVKLPGGGHGSPVLWGDRIFLMCCDDRTAGRTVVCLNAADGSVVWTRLYESQRFKMNSLNSYGATTPVVDKDRLYVAWSSLKSIVVRALDHDGKDLWDRDLGPHSSQHGPCTSPMLFESTVVMTNDQQGGSCLLALDAATGKTLWKLPRPSGRAAYSTPCILRPDNGEAELIVTSTASGVTSVNPRTGQVNWQHEKVLPERCVSSPVIASGLVVATCGTGPRGKLFAVRRPTGSQAETVYSLTKNAPYVPCPLLVDGRLFLFGDAGHITCLVAATGKQLWQEKVPDTFFGSPVFAAGRIYCISRKGNVFVLAAGDKYELLATNPLGEKSFATPAVAGGRMYLRSYNHLISIGGKKAG
ncbi:MAG: PQQ-binding-like beta-propeller repeat protein [Phycisphaerae bacterium]